MSIKIDILICSYNEAPHIPGLLESLRQQTVGPESFRVIFVDNASNDDTRRVVQENAHGLDLEYFYEGRPGKNWACNAGYGIARTPYVAHIDADARADRRWLENILRVIREQQQDLFGGPYFPYYISDKPAWYLDRYNSETKGDAPRYLQDNEYLHGTNMVWRRSLVERLGGFDVNIGITGRGFARGDETNLMIRARREIPNFKVFYDPAIVVYHLTREQYFSLWYWARCQFAQGMHDPAVWNTTMRKRSRYLRLAQFFVSATVVGAKGAKALVRRNREKYPYWENYWYERMLPEIYRLGGIWELLNQRSGQ
ncbi:MAG TPA: glycosyltransferase [Pyrinomonadaceae bacterium]|jgi:glycosyltransferase involved in cell wall biosynthesis